MRISDWSSDVCSSDLEGQIAVRRPDPVMFLEYWRNPEATAAKFAGDWLLTGDSGVRDGQGYFRFVGRDDDIITSSGYRVGSGGIENCLISHPAVAMAAAVGVPAPVRVALVKPVVVLRDGALSGPELEYVIPPCVRPRLAPPASPRAPAQ